MQFSSVSERAGLAIGPIQCIVGHSRSITTTSAAASTGTIRMVTISRSSRGRTAVAKPHETPLDLVLRWPHVRPSYSCPRPGGQAYVAAGTDYSAVGREREAGPHGCGSGKKALIRGFGRQWNPVNP